MLHDKVGLSGEDFHAEDAELIGNLIDLVDHGPDRAVFLLEGECQVHGKLRRAVLTSKITWPMRCLYGRYSSFRFRCAGCS